MQLRLTPWTPAARRRRQDTHAIELGARNISGVLAHFEVEAAGPAPSPRGAGPPLLPAALDWTCNADRTGPRPTLEAQINGHRPTLFPYTEHQEC
jgi:hypothetical protein